ncbi:MAG: hypothetical protein KGS45_14240 [Planctomycetes bacterium]|nr:hypothetical protein [Planctomycetota bacterium]
MKQISTGAGLVALSAGMVATAFIATQRGGEAYAQAGSGERRIVSASLFQHANGGFIAYRIWSDNVIDVRNIGGLNGRANLNEFGWGTAYNPGAGVWRTLDDGTGVFLRSDVDQSRTVDAGDIGATLLDFGKETGDPPPPIDCTINSPR